MTRTFYSLQIELQHLSKGGWTLSELHYGRGNQPIRRVYFLVSRNWLLKKHCLNCFAVPLANPCNSQPCANGGTCSFDPIKNEYRCRCLGKFTGKNCEGIQLK